MTTRARRIVDTALELEAEGVDPEAAFEAACARVSASSGAYRLAGLILRGLDKRARRDAISARARDSKGRFA